MLARVLMRVFVAVSVAASVAGVAWVYVRPPEGMRVTRDGVPHLSPPVTNPATGEAVPLEQLVRHFKGGGR
ncbi:MAG: hypothetical protein IT519_14340 [Burkholderiales bacterium]|nr:hypothetical protein [Burkholderiales bacterium]